MKNDPYYSGKAPYSFRVATGIIRVGHSRILPDVLGSFTEEHGAFQE